MGDFPKSDICMIAVKNGWLDLLKWARKNGCNLKWNMCDYAARH